MRINTLWVGKRLSNIETLCLKSWLAQGHDVSLYQYNDIANVPAGVACCDANKILPESRIFRYTPQPGHPGGGLGGFANLFRYHLLAEQGGWWLDTDVVLLRPLTWLDKREYVFAWQNDDSINNAVIKVPPKSELCTAILDAIPEDVTTIIHGETGPALFTTKIKTFGMIRLALPPRTFYPIHWRKWRTIFEAHGRVPRKSYGIHLWHDMLRRAGHNKNAQYARSSIYEKLRRRFK